MSEAVRIEAHYWPCIDYFCLLSSANELILEDQETFQKQTYRNRCYILTSQGIDMLTVPVVKARRHHRIKDTKINYSEDWQNKHLRALQSSYGKAPYFDFYKDYIFPVVEKKHTYLFDLNVELLTLTKQLIQIPISLSFSGEQEGEQGIDYRSLLKTGPERSIFKTPEYFQMFGKEFVGNLSILDLLFSKGPETYSFLKDMYAGNTER